MRTMSACCLTVYAKSPGLAMDGLTVVRWDCGAENRCCEYTGNTLLWRSCGICGYSVNPVGKVDLFRDLWPCPAEGRLTGRLRPVGRSRSIPSRFTILHPWIPILAQIQLEWIHRLDQRDLFRLAPPFNCFSRAMALWM